MKFIMKFIIFGIELALVIAFGIGTYITGYHTAMRDMGDVLNTNEK